MPAQEPESDAWDALVRPLGLTEGANAHRFWTPLGGILPIEGIVEQPVEGEQHPLLLQLHEPAPGIGSLFALPMSGQVYLLEDFLLSYRRRLSVRSGHSREIVGDPGSVNLHNSPFSQ